MKSVEGGALQLVADIGNSTQSPWLNGYPIFHCCWIKQTINSMPALQGLFLKLTWLTTILAAITQGLWVAVVPVIIDKITL